MAGQFNNALTRRQPATTSPRVARLMSGSALVGVLTALTLVAGPQHALAANECGVAAPGATVTCAPGAYPSVVYTGVSNVTVTLPAGVTVTTGGVSETGTGDLAVNIAAGDTVTSSAVVGNGIRAISSNGQTLINASTTTATGAGGVGIIASGATGVTVNATTTATTGATSFSNRDAEGIVVNSGGFAIVRSGAVSTKGNDATAIQIDAAGPITVTSTDIKTSGDGAAHGIQASSPGAITIDSGKVLTNGRSVHGLVAIGRTGAVAITSADVRTLGLTSDTDLTEYNASLAPLYGVGPGPQVIASNAVTALTTTGAITITSGIAQTAGIEAAGIVAISVSGAVDVTSTTITTSGEDGTGIVANGAAVTVRSGSVSTAGDDAGAIAVNATGAVAITSTDIKTIGAGAANGVVAVSPGAITIDSGKVLTSGQSAHGIVALGRTAAVNITSADARTLGTTHDPDLTDYNADLAPIYGAAPGAQVLASNAITALSTTGAITVKSGIAQTADTQAAGIVAISNGGAVSVTSTTAKATGAGGKGIVANGVTGATINSGAATTTGGVSAVGGVNYVASAISSTVTAGAINITSGAASSQGAFASAIFANSKAGSVTINSGVADAAGTGASAIYAVARDNIAITSTAASSAGAAGTLTNVDGAPTGVSAFGAQAIFASSTNGDVSITSGSASATGTGAAIFASGKTVNVTTNGATNSAGFSSPGIRVLASQAANVVINGALATTGANSEALLIAGGGVTSIDVAVGGSIISPFVGVSVYPGALTINNLGRIQANLIAIAGGDGVVINNWGSIISSPGNTAIYLSGSSNTLNLFTGSNIVGNVSGVQTVNLNGAINTKTASQVFGGNITGSVVALNANSGFWTLNSGYVSNATTIALGATLQIDDIAGQPASLTTGSFVNNGGFIYNTVNTIAYAGIISGSGSLTKIGGGALTLSAAQAYTGGTSVSGGSLIVTGALASGASVNAGGTLQIGAGGAVGTVTGPIVDNGTVILDRTNDFTLSGAFSGNGALIKRNANTVTLSGPYSFTGTTSILGGALNISQLASTGGLVVSGGTVNLGAGTQTVASLNGAGGAVVIPTGGVLDVDSGTFGGALTGGGGLLVNGAGTLNLTGANTFSGPTTVTGGVFAVNGSSISAVNVSGGGTLGGAGTISNNVTIGAGGVLNPGNSPGTLNVVGTLTFAAGSTYVVEALANGVSDKVNVTGQAIIQSGSSVRVTPTDALAAYGRLTNYNILNATGGVSGTFSTVNSTLAFLTPHLSYTANAVNLALTRNDISFASLASTANQAAVGAAVEAGGFGTPLYSALVVQDAAGSRVGYDALSGEALGSVGTALIDQSQVTRQANWERLASDGDGVQAWGKALGAWSRGGSGGVAATHNDMTGLAIGIDHPLGAWRGGVSASYIGNSIDSTARTSAASAKSTAVSAYGGGALGALEAKVSASYAWHSIDTTRAIAFTGFTDRASASYSARDTELAGELAFKTTGASVALQPFASLAWNQLSTDGFAEAGGAAALRVAKETRSVLFARLGLRSSTQLGEGVQLQGSLAWVGTSGDTDGVARAAFIGTGQAFATNGSALNGSAAELGVKLSAEFGGKGHINLSYRGEYGSDLNSNTLEAGVSWKF